MSAEKASNDAIKPDRSLFYHQKHRRHYNPSV
jgi:hypothetical protein